MQNDNAKCKTAFFRKNADRMERHDIAIIFAFCSVIFLFDFSILISQQSAI